jgi:hypothetical protein
MQTNNPQHIIAALNVENRQLRQQIQQLASQRSMQALADKLICAALTGAVVKATTAKEAAQIAVEAAQAVIEHFNPPQEEAPDHEINQRP